MSSPAITGRAGTSVELAEAMTSELGTPRVPEMVAGSGTTDPYETTRELVWPANQIVFEKMRRTDSQVKAQLQALKMPALGIDWGVSRGGRVAPEVSATVEAELGLVKDEDGRRRSLPGGVSWDVVLGHALLMLDFGHCPQELWWQPGTSDVAGLTGRPTYHLRMSPRLPRSLWRIDVDSQGLLTAVWQLVTDGYGRFAQRAIPRSSLVWFANQQEGADYSGRSLLRSAYKNWMIKDGLLKIGALAADRQGMGIPVVTYPTDGGDNAGKKAEALAIARAVRAGDDAGVALPEGWSLALVGVTGQTVDVLPQVRYHDSAIAKSALAMFMELGTTEGGHRALGQTFLQVFMQAQRVMLRYVEEVMTEEVSKRIVEVNFGVGVPYPSITAEEVSEELAAESIAALAASGALGDLNDGVVAYTRRRYGLPDQQYPPQPTGQLPGPPPVLLNPATGLPVHQGGGVVPPVAGITAPGPVAGIPTSVRALPGTARPIAAPHPLAPPAITAPGTRFAAGHDPLAIEPLTDRLERAVATLASLR